MSKVIVFDGVCNLCSGWVRFLLARDRRRQYLFAAVQGPTGRRLMQDHGLNPDDPVSFLLLDGSDVYTDSEAIIRILTSLGGGWRSVSALRVLPRALRDAGYRWLARNRYRFFGKRSSCYLPSPDTVDRFLD